MRRTGCPSSAENCPTGQAAARQLLMEPKSVLRKLAMSTSRVGKALDASAVLSAGLLAEMPARLESDTAAGFQGFAWATDLVGDTADL